MKVFHWFHSFSRGSPFRFFLVLVVSILWTDLRWPFHPFAGPVGTNRNDWIHCNGFSITTHVGRRPQYVPRNSHTGLCSNECSEIEDERYLDSQNRDQGRHERRCNSTRTMHGLSRQEFISWNAIMASCAFGVLESAETSYAEDMAEVATAAVPSGDNLKRIEPFSSVRKYKTISLLNGMKVLIVNDRLAIQSSAALTINGAGQFSDPSYLNGLAHLMEHMVLSSKIKGSKGASDFQDWLDGDYAEGFSNGFTAYEKVCFHFQCADEAFGEALDRFANLFQDDVVAQACQNRDAIKREIRRVDSELDKNDLFTRELYLTKSLINPEHPYAKVTLGSIETLETLPEQANINISRELYSFYKKRYRPDEAILVIVGSASISALESMVQTFSTTMVRSRKEDKKAQNSGDIPSQKQRNFPPLLIPGKVIGPLCLFRGKVSNDILADNLEKISFQWALDLEYQGLRERDTTGGKNRVVTATEIGFLLAEILGRRGPGSLFRLLQSRKWLPEGNRGVPRISFPVDVSGFQILRLEIIVSQEGFAKRSSVIAAVFDYLGCLRSTPPSRELIAQYCAVGQLYGHLLAPRAPDAIELAFDGQVYGVDGPQGVGTPSWRLMPFPDDLSGVQNLQRALQSVLVQIGDPSNAIIIMTASQRAILSQRANDLEEAFPLFSPASWNISPTTQARYLPQNNVLTGKINEWLVARISPDRLEPPVLNPFIPPSFRPPRIPSSVQNTTATDFSSSIISSYDENFPKFAEGSLTINAEQSSLVRDYWALLKVFSCNDPFPGGMLPRAPPEASSRSLFVLQLLSSRPPRATAQMAAHAEVWRISLEYALVDLAELGAPAGLAYDISYNKYGMRICFLGLSQNIASYARRIARRMVDHTNQLLEGPEQLPSEIIEASIRNTNRFRMSPQRKAIVTNTLKQTTAVDAATEGTGFFQSCSGAVCFSQGDLLPGETLSLMADLKKIYRKSTGINVRPAPAVPEVSDLLYRANWIPRAASVCSISGSTLVSNPCGRVPR